MAPGDQQAIGALWRSFTPGERLRFARLLNAVPEPQRAELSRQLAHLPYAARQTRLGDLERHYGLQPPLP
jgi:hypothetical protein